MILLKMADVGLIVTRANYSKKAFLKNVDKFSKEHDLNNLGFILNGLESSKRHGYGYGYGYGTSKGTTTHKAKKYRRRYGSADRRGGVKSLIV